MNASVWGDVLLLLVIGGVGVWSWRRNTKLRAIVKQHAHDYDILECAVEEVVDKQRKQATKDPPTTYAPKRDRCHL